MKKILARSIKIIAINLLLLVLLLESGSIALYFHQTGRFFYFAHHGADATITRPPDNPFLDEGGPTTVKRTLHPYLGFVYEEHARKRLQFSNIDYAPNNVGILSPYGYPYKKTSDDQFIVGIFGGSVAMYYGFYEFENHVLTNALKQLPYFQNKQIIVLPFASGSYKQPQQLLELNYFTSLGQDFDLVINIDGFNETALAYLNNKSGLDSSMPSVEMFGPLVQLANRGFSTQELILTLEILKLKDELKETEAGLNRCRFATCYTFRWMQLRYLLREYQKKSENFGSVTRNRTDVDSLVHVDKHEQPLDDATLIPGLIALWAKSESSMNQLLTANRVPYFIVVQPNQYYSTGRKFSEAEAKVALNSSSIYSEGVIKAYPKLIAQTNELKRSGVKIINAVNVFDETQDAVYVDSCCHYNRAGNELLARFIAGQIVKSLETEPMAR